MTAVPPRATRPPRDTRTRERLREAQHREATAVAAVCAAEQAVHRARAKRDAIVASATVTVDQAQAALEAAQSALVAVSGIDRAALLLGIDAAALRKRVARSGRSADQ